MEKPDEAVSYEKYSTLVGKRISESDKIKDWRSDLSRLIRRSEIHHQLKSRLPLGEIKAVVREHEKNLDTATLVNELVAKEFVVSPVMASVASQLGETLKNRFRFVDSVVLLGSAVHGGSVLRKNMTRQEDPGDLDWAIVYKGNPGNSRIRSMLETSKNLLPEISHKNGLKTNIISCSFLNPLNFSVPKLGNIEEAKRFFKKVIEDKKMWTTGIYFEPSFPDYSNINNRQILLSCLSKLYDYDRSFWKESIDVVMEGWHDVHRIKPKHLTDLWIVSGKDSGIRESVTDSSGFVMETAMRTLLESTADKVVSSRPSVFTPSQ